MNIILAGNAVKSKKTKSLKFQHFYFPSYILPWHTKSIFIIYLNLLNLLIFLDFQAFSQMVRCSFTWHIGPLSS